MREENGWEGQEKRKDRVTALLDNAVNGCQEIEKI